MGTVRYTVIDGEIIAEKRNGVRKQYVPDSLGSTVALLDNTQTQTDTFTYWPYGEVANRTGTTPTPFQYVGTAGYYSNTTGRAFVGTQVLDMRQGRWISENPFNENTSSSNYSYASDSPTFSPNIVFLSPQVEVVMRSRMQQPTSSIMGLLPSSKCSNNIQQPDPDPVEPTNPWPYAKCDKPFAGSPSNPKGHKGLDFCHLLRGVGHPTPKWHRCDPKNPKEKASAAYCQKFCNPLIPGNANTCLCCCSADFVGTIDALVICNGDVDGKWSNKDEF